LKKNGLKKERIIEKGKSVRFQEEDLIDEAHTKPRLFGTGEY
jgi:hypothetical protein